MNPSFLAWAQFGLCVSAIGVAGFRPVRYGDAIAALTGLSRNWVGMILIATSVPELATTLGAMRIGAIDMALGNLLGSNLFDVLILVLGDLAYLPGPIYRHVAQVHGATAITAAMMSGAVIVALACRPSTRVLHSMSWASSSLVVLYLINAAVQFRHGQ